jgi:hypothetical protein
MLVSAARLGSAGVVVVTAATAVIIERDWGSNSSPAPAPPG